MKLLSRWLNSPPAKDEPSTPETTSKQSPPTTEERAKRLDEELERKAKGKEADLEVYGYIKGSRILVIPDTQVKPGVNTDHLEWAGRYAVKMKPDVIVHIGDHWDMPSLSSYDKKGSRQMEGKRYVQDIAAGNEAMDRFMAPITEEVDRG